MTVETMIRILQQMKPDTPVVIETLTGERQVLGEGLDCIDGDEWETTIYTEKTEEDALADVDAWVGLSD